MKDVSITCDQCGGDLTFTANCDDYRLVVQSERLLPYPGGGAVTAMAVYPPVARAYHFCGLGCLRKHSLATGNEPLL